jgi:hypothetical protein
LIWPSTIMFPSFLEHANMVNEAIQIVIIFFIFNLKFKSANMLIFI